MPRIDSLFKLASKETGFGERKQRLSGAQPEISTSDTPIVRSSLAHWKSGFRFCDAS